MFIDSCGFVPMDPGQMDISIRRVGVEDHINIIKLFQTFDREKYRFIQEPEVQNNNCKTSLSLAGLRIDERGGIYLNPLLDSNCAYFKCYVAEEMSSGQLIGYILFFNTLDERSAGGGAAALDDPVAVVEDLFVKQNFRGRGVATQLWRKVLKSSLDRGCYSCECLLIPDSKDGLLFWEKRLGKEKMTQTLAQRKQKDEELIIELSRAEMKQLLTSTVHSGSDAETEEDL